MSIGEFLRYSCMFALGLINMKGNALTFTGRKFETSFV